VATRAQRGAAWRASAWACLSINNFYKLFCFTKTEKCSTILEKGVAKMAQYMTEKEILPLVSVGAVKGAQATVSVTRPGSWHLSFDLANGTSALIGTARGDLKNYTLPACAELVHSIGIDRFTVGLHGYTQK
jgi:hypothetical protein